MEVSGSETVKLEDVEHVISSIQCFTDPKCARDPDVVQCWRSELVDGCALGQPLPKGCLINGGCVKQT
ncbi:unnamed protein product [Acanthocheilonema viteae]|uniref:Uncharacterized protein n=1 Tax=Acanthocheilonema viteae TaxID=6277 RepID=A0A498SFD9_ACAVI|nr:unnamed protein product [Acanthocheilonema viteae]